jgi:hypothetical protein
MNLSEPPKRKQATPPVRPPVKTSVPLDVGTHAKLCAVSALRGVDRSRLAAQFIRAGLRGVVVIDKRIASEQSGNGDGLDQNDDVILAGKSPA